MSDAVLDDWRPVRPVRRPVTLARSLAIGAPADGDGAVGVVRRSGGSAASVSDEAIRDAQALIATTEGVLVEPAGGVVVATARELADRGVFGSNDRVVLYLTGNGYKQPDAFGLELRAVIPADADAFTETYADVIS